MLVSLMRLLKWVSTKRLLGVVVVLFTLVRGPLDARAEVDPQLLKLAADVYGAVDKARDAVADIQTVESVVKDIEAGKKPSVLENRWAAVASRYREAAEKLKSAPLPTEFDKSKYAFSLAELQSCDTRAAAISKAKGMLAELTDAQKRGAASLAALDAGASHAKASREALKYLIDVHAKLVSVPIYGEIFKWDWFALETDVSASLGTFESAVDSQRKKLNAEMAKLATYVSNLSSNVSGLEKLSCSIDGRWRGTISADGESFSIDVVVTKSGSTFGGQLVVDGAGFTMGNVVVNGRTISFTITVDEGSVRFSGTMAQDGFSLSGSFTSPDGSGSFSTKRL